MSASHALAADFVFDGRTLLRDAAVVIDGDSVAAVLPRDALGVGIPVDEAPEGHWITPGFIDLQVNGGGDVLLNDDPTVEGVLAIARAHRRFGTTGLLPTLITDAPERMAEAIAAVREAMRREPAILGIHLEGPFLSARRPGVHRPQFIRRPEPRDVQAMASLGQGATLVTLAPEEAPEGLVAALAAAGVTVAIGHTEASYEATLRAIDEGAAGFTHLFNAMPQLGSREPGPILAAFEGRGWFGIIADGIHVHPGVLRHALRQGRPVLVTDAMPPVGGVRSGFRLYGEEITVADGRCLREDGTLAGAALDMAGAVRNAVGMGGLSLEEALAMASAAPAEAIGLGDRLGRLAPGYRADLVLLDPGPGEVVRSWVAGRP